MAPIFLMRVAGVPFDVLDPFGTPDTFAAAHELLIRREEFAAAKLEAERLLRRRDHGMSVEAYRALRLALRAGSLPALGDVPAPRQSVAYTAAVRTVGAAESRL